MKMKYKIVLRSILIVILTLFILISIFLINDGYTIRIVTSKSMEPEIKVNSINIIKQCNINDIHIGDIICFKYNKDIIHRVIDITNDSGKTMIHTKGDANKKEDNIDIFEDMVIGKVMYTFNIIGE